jgi:hypothetical protein
MRKGSSVTLKTLMAIVVVFSVLFAGVAARKRHRIFSQKSSFYRDRADSTKASVHFWEEGRWFERESRRLGVYSPILFDGHPFTDEDIIKSQKELMHYYELLATKYSNAAARPWLSISPDPPQPLDLFPMDDEELEDARKEYPLLPPTIIKRHKISIVVKK